MTQSHKSQLLSLQLTPMQIPEAIPVSEVKRPTSWGGMGTKAQERLNLSLLLRPGEPSEMMVQVRNVGSRPVQLDLQVKGDFPQEWCRIGMEGSEVRVGQQMEAVLYFRIPTDFFESLSALHPSETLKLNYIVHLHAYLIESDTNKREVESTAFNLYVRPPSLYLNFLPAIYREVDFVGRFLKIFEQSLEPCVHTLENLWAYLDPLTAPQAMLPFLAHWVAWNQTPQIGLERQRYLIKSAMQIYQWRGTRQGLRFYLHLATELPLDDHISDEKDKHIGITEFFSRGCVFGEAKLGEDSIVGGSRPFHFTLHLRPEDKNQIDESFVRSVIEQEKPAFCTYDLIIESKALIANS